MTRRTFICGLTLGTMLAPLVAEAQQTGKLHRVGVLVFGTSRTPQEKSTPDTFVSTLRDLGWVEGRNLAIEDRRSMNVEQLHSLAAELVQLRVDVIYASGTPATRAASQATSRIPIVMLLGVDPVADGLVTSLARPGGNVTGLTALSSELIGKRLGLLREIIPGISRIAYMWNPANPGNVSASEEIAKVAPTVGLRMQPVPVRDPNEFDGAFATMTKGRVDALLVGADGMLVAQRVRLAELAIKHRIPAMYSFRVHAEAGGLLVYSADWIALYRRAAAYVDKILKGAKPADLPVEQPTKFELVINVKTAKALGLTIPQSLLMRADEIIQ